MQITEVPFNHFLGISESGLAEYILQLEPQPNHLNHLGTVHAAVLFALAEATSGDYLLKQRGDRSDIVGVLRRSSSKYSKPAKGITFSKLTNVADESSESLGATIDQKGRALFDIDVELFDQGDKKIASFGFTWLLSKMK